MFCTKCGHKNPDNYKFCSKCGKPLRIFVPPTNNIPQQSTKKEEESIPVGSDSPVVADTTEKVTTPLVEEPMDFVSTSSQLEGNEPSETKFEEPKSKSSVLTISIIGVVIIAILGAIGYFYFNRQSQENNDIPELKEFALDFAEKARKNQIDKLTYIYPDILEADSIALVYDESDIFISAIDEDKTGYEIDLSKNVKLYVIKDDDGNWIVDRSKGLFAYRENLKDLAVKTGLWDDSLYDAELGKRMNDKGFFEYLEHKKKSVVDNIMEVGEVKMNDDMMSFSQKLTNRTNVAIDGNDYNIIKTYFIHKEFGEWEEYEELVEGKDIHPRDYTTFEMLMVWHSPEFIVSGVKWKISEDELFEKFGSWTGKEYLRYINGEDSEPMEEILVTSADAIDEAPENSYEEIVNIVNDAEVSYESGVREAVEVVETPSYDDEHVFQAVEQMPRFPGGDAELMKFLSSNIHYPSEAAEKGIQGRVTVQMVIKKDGSVGEVKIVRGKDPLLDAEAVRVVKTLPNFIPGKMNGQPVNVWFTLPVNFKLAN